MAKEYVKSGASLVDVSGDKIRNFACLEDVRAAILAGELAEGDMFTTICQTTGQTEDIAQEVCRIASYIPADTSPTNQLMNHCDFEQIEGDIECRVQCCDFTDYTTANDACMSCRVQCCDFTDFQTANTTALNGKVACSDFNDNVTCVNNRLTAIENVSIPDLDTCICCAEERLTCLESRTDVLESITVDPTSGLVTSVSDLSADYHACCTNWNNLISCRVQCCDFTDFQTTNTTALNGKVTCTDYQTCCTAWDTAISDLSSCAGLSCTGTLVPSDLDTINTCIACLKSCPGLDCTGTVTGSRVSCSDFESCCSTWNTCISCLKSCSGLDCTGTLTSSDLDSYATKSCVCTIVNGIFSLSGNVLTITSA